MNKKGTQKKKPKNSEIGEQVSVATEWWYVSRNKVLKIA